MAVFEYNALNSTGKKIRGVIDADSIRSARLKLKEKGIFPTSMNEARADNQQKKEKTWLTSIGTGGVSTSQLAIATRQLATLVGSGMPLVESLKALGELLDHPSLKRVVAEVSERVNEGSELADAMRNYPRVFSKLYVNMISSGQANGRLDLVLDRLADLLEGQAVLRRKIISAITYPVLMLCLCLAVIVILLAYVIPEITVIFKDHKATLPMPTQIVIGLSNFMQNYWWIVVGGFALFGLAIIRYVSTPKGRRNFDQAKLSMPIFGPLSLKVATSRFARNLGTLIESDVPILEALKIVKNIVGNVLLEENIDNAIEGVKEGRSLSNELNKAKRFPRMLVHMISAGEQSGDSLAPMLLKAATAYEGEVNAVVSALTSILEPILIVFLAVVVGGILSAVMLPMLEMNTLALR